MATPVFVVRDLKVSFPTEDGPVQAVRGVDLTVNEGELVGVVGESGSGKSVSFLAVMGLLLRRPRSPARPRCGVKSSSASTRRSSARCGGSDWPSSSRTRCQR